ncbi:sel1 repeat family protein, partial [Vibrio parahaemolyticus]|nr:sel1 repeat family protein [Vibrio parahaemolyticus]
DLYMEMAGTDRLETLYSTVAESYQQITPRINAEQEKAADKIESSLKNSVDFYNHDLFWDI